MNNDLKYIFHGCLLTILLFISVAVIKFCIAQDNLSGGTITVIDYSDSINVIPFSQGHALFIKNCSPCHALNKKLAGPVLTGVEERWPSRSRIYDWVHNPAGFMKTDAYTEGLYKEYGIVMTAFPDLTNEQIDTILDYIGSTNLRYAMPVAFK